MCKVDYIHAIAYTESSYMVEKTVWRQKRQATYSADEFRDSLDKMKKWPKIHLIQDKPGNRVHEKKNPFDFTINGMYCTQCLYKLKICVFSVCCSLIKRFELCGWLQMAQRNGLKVATSSNGPEEIWTCGVATWNGHGLRCHHVLKKDNMERSGLGDSLVFVFLLWCGIFLSSCWLLAGLKVKTHTGTQH